MASLNNLVQRGKIAMLLPNDWAEKMYSLAANCLINNQI
jgi:hypothetical protein